MVNTFERFQSTTPDVNRLQTSILKFADQFPPIQLISGAFLPAVELTDGYTNVYHGLNRKYQMVIPSLPNVASTITETVSLDRSKYFTLYSTNACVINLYCF